MQDVTTSAGRLENAALACQQKLHQPVAAKEPHDAQHARQDGGRRDRQFHPRKDGATETAGDQRKQPFFQQE